MTRDRLWRASGVLMTERILVEDTTDDQELDWVLAAFVKQVANS